MLCPKAKPPHSLDAGAHRWHRKCAWLRSNSNSATPVTFPLPPTWSSECRARHAPSCSGLVWIVVLQLGPNHTALMTLVGCIIEMCQYWIEPVYYIPTENRHRDRSVTLNSLLLGLRHTHNNYRAFPCTLKPRFDWRAQTVQIVWTVPVSAYPTGGVLWRQLAYTALLLPRRGGSVSVTCYNSGEALQSCR